SAAALHHPNIATVFEIDEHDGQPFIAIEFVDGQTLEERIAKGPLPLKDAVSITSQVAEGLKVAHAANLVPRDIKSANVMLTRDGKAKILDFGLAKTAASTKLTQMGSTLGTVAYMSPQQARGEDVDYRTDLWSLGAVLYEMISGKLPFPGDFEQAVVYSILNEEPKPLTAVRTGVPMGLEWIVSKLLAKDPDDRYQNAADLLVDLRTVDLSSPGLSRVKPPSGVLPEAVARPSSSAGRIQAESWPMMALALAAGIAVTALAWYLWPEQQIHFERSVKRFEVRLPVKGSIAGLDISPDGGKIVYADLDNTADNVHVMDLSTGAIRTLDGSAGTLVVSISPDGEWVLLTKDLSIQRVSLAGGAPLTVTTSTEGTPRASWGPSDWIIFENGQAIWKASTSGSEARPLTIKDTATGEVDHDWPQMLPDGETMMATIEYLDKPSTIGFWDAETGRKKGQIPFPGYRVRYVPSGYLLFVFGGQTGNLVALPFDAATLSATGSLISVTTNVSTAVTTVSDGGTLVSGDVQGGELRIINQTRLFAVTFPSTARPLGFEPIVFRNFELSPDEKKLVAQINTVRSITGGLVEGTEDVWVLDLERGTQLQLTFGGSGRNPTWTAGGDSVAYVYSPTGLTRAMIRAADGSGEPRDLFDVNANMFDLDISPDGSHAAYVLGESNIGVTRLIVRDMHTGATVDLSGSEDANIRNPTFSPDGRYVAYERGPRILVRAIDGNSVPIYVGQARLPLWSRTGTKLIAGAADTGNLIAYDVSLTPTFSVDRYTPLTYELGQTDQYDVFSDGRSGIFNLSNPNDRTDGSAAPATRDTTATVVVTVNWLETLK
ncbi:MAG TPA: protein kinase, partial [Rhodothermales bacterium]|nr:protein kinase [Rhodothermales bacterium]